MYIEPELHSNINLDKKSRMRDRWKINTSAPSAEFAIVKQWILDSTPENDLLSSFDNGDLPNLADYQDLKGLQLNAYDFKKTDGVLDFTGGDHFKGIQFDYSSFYNLVFKNVTFFGTSFHGCDFYNLTFEDCTFVYRVNFSCSTFEKCKFINCDFIDLNEIVNCKFQETHFISCFFHDRTRFASCFMDKTTTLKLAIKSSQSERVFSLSNTSLSQLYWSIASAFRAANAYEQFRKFSFSSRRYFRKYNSNSWKERVFLFAQEFIMGYGLYPMRILLSMIAAFGLYTFVFSFKFGFEDALMLSAGGLFTFGAKTDLLNGNGYFLKFLYISSSFVGILLTALFVTASAALILRDPENMQG